MPSDVLAIVLWFSLWLASGSAILAVADGLGPHPARRLAIGPVLVAVSAAALWRRAAVGAWLRARPWAVLPLAAATDACTQREARRHRDVAEARPHSKKSTGLAKRADRQTPGGPPRDTETPSAQDDGWLDMRAAADYAGITANALRKATAARELRFEQAGAGAKCWFKRSYIDAWRQGLPAR